MEKETRILKEVKTDLEELKQKVREHKKKQLKRLAIIVGICVAIIVVFYIATQVKTYSKYKTIDSVERADTSATQFALFQGKILKYSNDGAIYTDTENNTIWNQTFEMDSPLVAMNDSYVAFADVDGQVVYILNEEGLQGTVNTTMSIKKIDVAEHGTIAVLMENQNTSYLALYNMEGDKLAEGAIHVENSGYPLDIALSDNGENLAVSILDINSGSVKTTLSFYNFGTVGQNKIDNIVNTFSYAGNVIPRLEYIDDTTMLAFADNGVMIFKGAQVPEQTGEVLVSSEIKSIFYDNSYFGLIIQDKEVENGRKMVVYDLNGTEVTGVSLDMGYDDVYFLKNHEICVQNENQCQIYTRHGVKKFESTFEAELYYVMNRIGSRNYTVLLDGSTEQIRCKVFSSTRFEGKEE